jgi:hypothetical protein
MVTAKKVTTQYLTLAAVLITAAAVVAIPFQQAIAQPTPDTRFLVFLVQGAQAGLVNVSVQIGAINVQDLVDVNQNNIAVPITVPVAANVGVVANVCATIISSGDQVCEQVGDLEQNARNRLTLDLSQAQ